MKGTVDTVMGIHLEQGPGDILVFLTGQVSKVSCNKRTLLSTCTFNGGVGDQCKVYSNYRPLAALQNSEAWI